MLINVFENFHKCRLACQLLQSMIHRASSSLCGEQVVLRRDGLVGHGRGEVELAGRTEALHRAEVVELEGRRRLRGRVGIHDCGKGGEEGEAITNNSVSHYSFIHSPMRRLPLNHTALLPLSNRLLVLNHLSFYCPHRVQIMVLIRVDINGAMWDTNFDKDTI